MALSIPMVSIDDLRQFHSVHFPHAPIPKDFLQGIEASDTQQNFDEGEYEEDVEAFEEFYEDEYEDDGLGYYPDGVKRTITDDHIAMFRHSEIQTILRERRRRRDEGDDASQAKPNTQSPPATQQAFPMAISPDPSESSTPSAQHQPSISLTEGGDNIQTGRVEKAQIQQWTKSSAKTKARNAKNRKKNRLNHRARKKEEIKRKNQNWKDEQGEEDEESDEWDPWHQANGPDAQKDSTIDLDY